MIELLFLVAEHECQDSIWWNSSMEFFLKCSDAFFWGCADLEPIKYADLPELKQALIDGNDDGILLFICRRRKLRPQGAMYEYLNKENWPLFDACGPVREVGLGNPKEHPTELYES